MSLFYKNLTDPIEIGFVAASTSNYKPLNLENANVIGFEVELRIKLSDWFFKSHFIGEPTMPGTLQIEAMLQTTVYLIYKSFKKF